MPKIPREVPAPSPARYQERLIPGRSRMDVLHEFQRRGGRLPAEHYERLLEEEWSNERSTTPVRR